MLYDKLKKWFIPYMADITKFQYLHISKSLRFTDTHTKKNQLGESWHIWKRYTHLKSSRHEEKKHTKTKESWVLLKQNSND